MSRFTKSKRNNVLLNALPINLIPSPTETELTQQLPITSIETFNSP
jgi:hypothetical protein